MDFVEVHPTPITQLKQVRERGGAWTCLQCHILNHPFLTECMKCQWVLDPPQDQKPAEEELTEEHHVGVAWEHVLRAAGGRWRVVKGGGNAGGIPRRFGVGRPPLDLRLGRYEQPHCYKVLPHFRGAATAPASATGGGEGEISRGPPSLLDPTCIPVFHGSGLHCWLSILRSGLQSLSGTRFQLNGAAYGNGLYLATDPSQSLYYSKVSQIGGALGLCALRSPPAKEEQDTGWLGRSVGRGGGGGVRFSTAGIYTVQDTRRVELTHLYIFPPSSTL